MLGKNKKHQFVRYVIVGIASNLVGYMTYLFLTLHFVGPKIAMTLVYLAGASFGYLGNRQWTFYYSGRVIPALIKYIIAQFSGYWLNFFLLYILVDQMSYPHQIVQLFAIFVVAGFLFIILKKYVFIKSTLPHSIHPW
jgi:putative flippase GtrA